MKLHSALKLPKEHGAWAMLYVPFVVGLLVAGRLNGPAILLLSSVTFLFIARESLLAWRTALRRKQPPSEALRFMSIYTGLAAVSGAPLVFIYHLLWLLPVGLGSLFLLAFNAQQAARREDRTTGGEILAITGLTLTAPAAYYAARGALDLTALWLWVLCVLYFTSSVFYVKLRVHSLNRRKEQLRRQTWRQCVLYHGALGVSLALLAFTGSLNLFILAAFSPVLARSFWQLARPAARINLRRVGVLELIYSIVFLIFTTLTFRML